MAVIELKKFVWTDSRTLTEYSARTVAFSKANPDTDGVSDFSARYDHTHKAANLKYDDNFQCINLVNKTKLYALKSQTDMEVWVSNEIAKKTEQIEWKNAVNNYSELLNVAQPKDGWMVPVLQDQTISGTYYQSGDYRYHDNILHPTGQASGWYLINSTKVPNASATINGLMTSADFTKLASLSDVPNFGTGHDDIARGDHNHDAVYVKLTDARLTDARKASDVYAWAKATTKPAYAFSEITSKPTTLAGYGITDSVSTNDPRMTNARPASDVYAWAKSATPPKVGNSDYASSLQWRNPDGSFINDYGVIADRIVPDSGMTRLYLKVPEGEKLNMVNVYQADRAALSLDVPAWAKAANKPSYAFSEITSKPTTLAGYGISDGVLTSLKVGNTDNHGYFDMELASFNVARLVIGANAGFGNKTPAMSISYGVVNFPNTPTIAGKAILHTDNIAAWAKAASKPSYTASEVGAATSLHTHTSVVGVYTGGGGNFAPTYVGNEKVRFNMRMIPQLLGNQTYVDCLSMNCYTGGDVPFVTSMGVSKTSYPRGFIASAPVGNTSVDSWVYREIACIDNLPTLASLGGVSSTDPRLTDARKASDVYDWAKAANKPSYAFSEITSKPTTLAGYGISDGVLTSLKVGNTDNHGYFDMELASFNVARLVIGANAGFGNKTPAMSISYGVVNFPNTPTIAGKAILHTDNIAAWAKAASKPSYTYSEVGAMPARIHGYGGVGIQEDTYNKTVLNLGWSAALGDYTQLFCSGQSSAMMLMLQGNGILSWNGSTVWHTGNFNPDTKLNTSASCNKNWNWSGQVGQPAWLWGGNDAANQYLYNPSNFSVASATSSTRTTRLIPDGYGANQYDIGGTFNTPIPGCFNLQVKSPGDGANYLNKVAVGYALYSNNCNADLQMNSKWIRNCIDIAFASDIRLKKDFVPITQELTNGVLDIKPFQYEFKKEPGKKRVGYIAQDVQAVFPDMVSVNHNEDDEENPETLAFSYRELMILKLEALVEEVNNLKQEIADLKRNK